MNEIYIAPEDPNTKVKQVEDSLDQFKIEEQQNARNAKFLFRFFSWATVAILLAMGLAKILN